MVIDHPPPHANFSDPLIRKSLEEFRAVDMRFSDEHKIKKLAEKTKGSPSRADWVDILTTLNKEMSKEKIDIFDKWMKKAQEKVPEKHQKAYVEYIKKASDDEKSWLYQFVSYNNPAEHEKFIKKISETRFKDLPEKIHELETLLDTHAAILAGGREAITDHLKKIKKKEVDGCAAGMRSAHDAHARQALFIKCHGMMGKVELKYDTPNPERNREVRSRYRDWDTAFESAMDLLKPEDKRETLTFKQLEEKVDKTNAQLAKATLVTERGEQVPIGMVLDTYEKYAVPLVLGREQERGKYLKAVMESKEYKDKKKSGNKEAADYLAIRLAETYKLDKHSFGGHAALYDLGKTQDIKEKTALQQLKNDKDKEKDKDKDGIDPPASAPEPEVEVPPPFAALTPSTGYKR